MNLPLIVASGTIIALALIHSVFGEWKLIRQLDTRGLPTVTGFPLLWNNPDIARSILRAVWHVASLFALAFATILIVASLQPTPPLIVRSIGVCLAASGFVVLVLSRGSHLGWIALGASSVLCFAGAA